MIGVIKKQMRKCVRRPTIFWLLLYFVAQVSVILVWQWHQTHRLRSFKIADELGTIDAFWSSINVNHANTHLLFSENTTTGVGLFLCDLDGKIQTIAEFSSSFASLIPLGWSLDDSLLAYAFDHNIWVARGDTGAKLVSIPFGKETRPSFAWLGASSLAIISNTTVLVFSRHAHKWSVESAADNVIPSTAGDYWRRPHIPLVSFSDHSVAWLRNGVVSKWEIGSPSFEFCRILTNAPVDIATSDSESEALLNCGTNGGTLSFISKWYTNQFVSVSEHLTAAEPYVVKPSSLDGRNGIVYLGSQVSSYQIYPSMSAQNSTLYLKKGKDFEPIQILGTNEVLDYTLGKDSIYIIGSAADEPAAIWQYSISSGALKHVYGKNSSFKGCQFQPKRRCRCTNESGGTIVYDLWLPDTTLFKKPYPLLLGQTAFGSFADAQLAVMNGWAYAFAERPLFDSQSITNWEADVLAVSKELVKSELVDTNCMCLFSFSRESYFLSRMFKHHPDVWKGAFMQSPQVAPVVSPIRDRNQCFYLIKEEGDKDGIKELAKYQDQALRSGSWTRLLKRGGDHWAIATPDHTEYLRDLSSFLIDAR